jgi:hypothetical protein
MNKFLLRGIILAKNEQYYSMMIVLYCILALAIVSPVLSSPSYPAAKIV